MSCCCLSRLGHLAALPGNTGQCHGCCHHENTALGVPQLPCHRGVRGSLPKPFLASPTTWAIPPQPAELLMSSATAQRPIRSLQGLLLRVSALICNIHTRPDRESLRGQEHFQ